MARMTGAISVVLLCVVGCGATGGGAANPGADESQDFLVVNGDRPPPPVADVDEEQGEGGATSEYLKVPLAGTISTDNNEASVHLDTGEGMTAFEYISDYSIELWFPGIGGEAIQQRNWIALREGGYIPVYYGTATECDYAPYPNAYDEKSFELEATLTLNGLLLDGEPADELSLHLPALPSDAVTVSVLCPSGVPADVTDPGPYTQPLMYWYMDTIVQAFQLDRVMTNSWTDVPMMPSDDKYYLDISQNANYTTVANLE